MDAHLKRLADGGLALAEAEEHLDATAWQSARERLDEADAALGDLRAAWPSMSAAERAVVGATAAPLRERLEAGRRRLPRLTAVALGTPEHDPDEDLDPAA